METIERALAEEGPLTRAQLRERLDAAGVPTAGQALIHLLFLAALRGVAVRGPMVGKQHAYVLVRDWLGPQPSRSTATPPWPSWPAATWSATGPADDRDLARWAGLPLRDARAGLAAIASELVEREDGLVDLAKRPPVAELPGAAPARRLRPAAARLDLARGNRRPAQAAGDHQRHLPPLRPGRRPRRRHLEAEPAARSRSSPSARSRRRRRRARGRRARDVERFMASASSIRHRRR